MNRITPVSVTTDAKVPIKTAIEACSTQAAFCREITNTGGSEPSSTATAAQGWANGPNNNIRAKAVRGWIRSLTKMTPGTSQGTRLNEGSATVTPSTTKAAGAAGVLQEQKRIVDRNRRLDAERPPPVHPRPPTWSTDLARFGGAVSTDG